MKDLFSKFDKKAFWEAIKLPLRMTIFAALGFIIDFCIQYFAGVNTPFGYILWVALTALDKYLHEIRAADSKKPLEGFDRGLLPF